MAISEKQLMSIYWAEQVPINGHQYLVLQLLANETDQYGRGTKSMHYLSKQGLLSCEEIDVAIKFLKDNKIIIIFQSHNPNLICYQLRIKKDPKDFKDLANKEC